MSEPLRLFAFRLAKELGYANVDAMLATIPLPMLYEWLAYAEREPFGEERADLRAGIVASVMANAWSGKGSRQFKPADFMPKFGADAEKKRQTPQEVHNLINGMWKAQQRQLENANRS